ncbi:MAG: TPM domain-containing protein [Synechococcus sp.]
MFSASVRSLPSNLKSVWLGAAVMLCVMATACCVFGMTSQSAMAQQELPVVEMDLPQPEVEVLDFADQLSANQESRLNAQLKALENDTGWKLRVLTQFDKSPGRTVKSYWGLNDRSVLMVADPRGGNLLAFNVGDRVREVLPRTFWIELQSRYGNQFFVRDNGKAQSIQSTVDALDTCFREGGCRVVPGLPDEHWIWTLFTSIAGGIICGFAGKQRHEDELFNWQWALLFSPMWLLLFGGFGLAPVLRRTTDWLPIARNVLGFLAGLLTIYVLPFSLPFGQGSDRAAD